MQESMLSATQLGTYTKFITKQKSTMLAILHVPSVTGLVVDSNNYRTWDTYAASDAVMTGP